MRESSEALERLEREKKEFQEEAQKAQPKKLVGFMTATGVSVSIFTLLNLYEFISRFL